jgi:hypothetical protein
MRKMHIGWQRQDCDFREKGADLIVDIRRGIMCGSARV